MISNQENKTIHSMNRKQPSHVNRKASLWGRLGGLLLLSTLLACSEADDTVSDYADWQERNDEWFAKEYAHVYSMAAGGRTDYALFCGYQKGDSTLTAHDVADYVLVRRIDSLATPVEEYPLFSDSVKIHYAGRLIPTVSSPAGYLFDSSFSDTFDPEVAKPKKFAMNSVVSGFSTALQHMRRGDHWQVIVPYALGYGENARSDIPAYSTLVFDVRLEDFW